MKQEIIKEVLIPGEVKVSLDAAVLKVKGPKGEITRNFAYPKISLAFSRDAAAGDNIGNKIIISSQKATKKEKKIIGSFFSHIKNMVRGVVEPYVYKLKICSGHFPMAVSVSGRELVIKNFLGETVPRKVKLPEGADVKVSGAEIVVSSVDIEIAGLTAGRIEQACRITNRDLRIFQDGCYIVEKAGFK